MTVIMTFPAILHMGNTVNNPGDPLYYSWLMSWEIHSLLTYPSSFFDGNIFYPLKKTVAFSDHMFGSTLIFAVPYLILKNPVFAYNVVFLLTFFLSGYGMYLLVY